VKTITNGVQTAIQITNNFSLLGVQLVEQLKIASAGNPKISFYGRNERKAG
jgi:hypothetical protein